MCLCNVSLFGLDPQRDIRQLAHRFWGERDGYPGETMAMAQTTDGFLWLGTFSGLYRFDGMRFELYPYESRTGDKLPAHDSVFSLLALPDGSLWIGYALKGRISVLRNGNVKNYGSADGLPPDTRILNMAQDHDGTMWANTDVGLVRFNGTRWELIGGQWNIPQQTPHVPPLALFVDSRGTLWVGIRDTVMYLRQGSKQFEPTGVFASAVTSIKEAPDGTIWIADVYSAVRVISMSVSARSATRARCEVRAPQDAAKCPSDDQLEIRVGASNLLFDRNGSLWISTVGDGLRRAPDPQRLKKESIPEFGDALESFTSKNGLSADKCYPILEDREGNIWVATSGGLDQFRDTKLVPIVFPEGKIATGMAPADGGYVWVASDWKDLTRIHGDSMSLPFVPTDAYSVYRDPSGVTWLWGTRGIQRWENGSFKLVADSPKGFTGALDNLTIAGDNSGTIWAFAKGLGFLTLDHNLWKAWPTPPEVAKLWPTSALCDSTGRIWVSTYTGEIVTMDKGKIVTYSVKQTGLKGTPVSFAERGPKQLWAAGGSGLTLFDNGRIRPIKPSNPDHFLDVAGIVDAGGEGLWLTTQDVVVHIPRDELDKALRDPSYRFLWEQFDSNDGLPGKTELAEPFPKVIRGTDGRLWFAGTSGIAWIDPKRVLRNAIPPPVVITSVSGDGTSHLQLADVRLPARTANVQINYTALSLSVPERVHFRYKLDGIDKDWQDQGAKRDVSYSRLPPGRYQFHVIACNDDGIWNNIGASLSFAIAPVWFQTIWFEFLVAAAALALVWTAYTLRLKQVTARIQERLGTRMEERERIARELHDTLLQSFQGLTLQFQRARNLLPDRAAEAIPTLDKALDGAEEAIIEGRDAIHDLRSPTTAAKALAEEIRRLGEELVPKGANTKGPVEFRLVVEGSARPMRPNLQIEVFRITREALRNAFSHSQGHLIETELAYTESLFRLRVRDDGTGIDLDERARAERSGHWGLKGMRERAERLGGELEVWSEPGAGTEIELRVPASIAYETVRSPDNPWQFWRRKRNS